MAGEYVASDSEEEAMSVADPVASEIEVSMVSLRGGREGLVRRVEVGCSDGARRKDAASSKVALVGERGWASPCTAGALLMPSPWRCLLYRRATSAPRASGGRPSAVRVAPAASSDDAAQAPRPSVRQR